jgi:hypothetical protein
VRTRGGEETVMAGVWTVPLSAGSVGSGVPRNLMSKPKKMRQHAKPTRKLWGVGRKGGWAAFAGWLAGAI